MVIENFPAYQARCIKPNLALIKRTRTKLHERKIEENDIQRKSLQEMQLWQLISLDELNIGPSGVDDKNPSETFSFLINCNAFYRTNVHSTNIQQTNQMFKHFYRR